MVSVGFKKAFIVTTEDAGTVMATVVLSAPSEVSFSVLVTAHHDSATGNSIVPVQKTAISCVIVFPGGLFMV